MRSHPKGRDRIRINSGLRSAKAWLRLGQVKAATNSGAEEERHGPLLHCHTSPIPPHSWPMNRLLFGDNLQWLRDAKLFPDDSYGC